MKPLSYLFLFALLFATGQFTFAQTAGDYRSLTSGTWSTTTTWERYNGSSWVAAPAAPSSTDGVITIQSGHTVQITTAVTMDQVVINSGGMINWTASTCTVAAGAGVDLQVDGIFWDNRGATTPSITFNSGATWQLGANGTLRRSAGNSSNNWQGAYEGGIATIPATSNWVLQRNASQNPSISTIGAFYGNLIIENNVAGTWTTPAASTFQGAGGFPTIKGNFDLGGSGSNTVNFINQHTNASPTLVMGNVTIRSGNTFQNNGTGIEVRGNLVNSGTITYDANDGRNVNFTGGNAQTITNTGSLGIFNFTINKSANSLTLNNSITVDNSATFTSGLVNSTLTNLFILNSATTVSGPSNASFVNGPVRRLGSTGITYPIGKGSSYRPLILGTGAGASSFWTENFGTSASCGASQGTLVSAYSGPNGAWTLTTTTAGTAANAFYVSATEAGMGSGSCGDGCLSNGTLLNNTLHVGNVSTSPAAGFFCPTGDCGAAFDAGLGSGTVLTDKRAESPVINCTGKSTITLTFEYIENGAGTNDNGLLWYFDGSSWSLLVDIPKSATGSCGSQGTWTTYSVTLPASANNNANVRIGFQWVNNDDGAGNDPSFAVDNISLAESQIFTAEYFPSNPQIPYGNVLAPTLTNLSDCEYWILSRDAGNSNRTVGLTWNSATCYNTAFASFEVARFDGISTWQDHDGIVSGSASGGTVTTPAVVSSFSPFAIAYVPVPLPIELVKFTAECVDGKVQFMWQTASEINNDYFTVEKSSDMQEWTEVARVTGAGNSNVLRSYESTDLNPARESYYRLKQTDFNAQFEAFTPVYVSCVKGGNDILVYPNPATDVLYISLPEGSDVQRITLENALGQTLRTITVNSNLLTIPLEDIPKGWYIVKLQLNGSFISKIILRN